MHILEIPIVLPPLGGEFCIEQARALKALGHEVRILSCNQYGILVEPQRYITARLGRWEEDINGVTAYRSNMHGMPRMPRWNLEHWCNTICSMYNEYKTQYGKPDILHAHCSLPAGIAAEIISRKENIPYVITEHTPSGIYNANYGVGWQRHLWQKDMIRENLNHADYVIPVAQELVEDIAPFFGKDYKYKVISNIIDTDFFHYHSREPFEQGKRPFRYCCIALGDVYRKGYDVLAEAFRGIEGAELYIAGRWTTEARITQLFDKCQGTHFVGTLDRTGVRDLLYNCDALVLASRSEVQPLVLLEAMATGMPVVATECTPKSERIEGACLIAEISNAESLREQMLAVQKIKPSKATSESIWELASPKSVAKQIVSVFQEVLCPK